jgi:hypothetical protein
MEQGMITCPNCGQEFEMSDALTGRLREHLKEELLQDVKRREARIKEKTEALKAQEAQVAKSREAIEEEIEAKLKERLSEVEKKAAKKLEGRYADQLKELQSDLEEKDAAIKTFREQELELRKEQRKLKEAAESLELEVARKLDAEREKICEEVSKKAAEDHRLKDLEKDKLIKDLQNSVEDMKRKAEQGSMETQGEVLEQDFEAQLQAFFVHDDIQPVPKGIKGADLVQTVRTPMGGECGILLWGHPGLGRFAGRYKKVRAGRRRLGQRPPVRHSAGSCPEAAIDGDQPRANRLDRQKRKNGSALRVPGRR